MRFGAGKMAVRAIDKQTISACKSAASALMAMLIAVVGSIERVDASPIHA